MAVEQKLNVFYPHVGNVCLQNFVCSGFSVFAECSGLPGVWAE